MKLNLNLKSHKQNQFFFMTILIINSGNIINKMEIKCNVYHQVDHRQSDCDIH